MTAWALRSPTCAPWAHIVPGVGPVTVDDLVSLPDDGWRYEVVEGMLVRMARSGEEATSIAAIVLGALISFIRPRRLGVITGADGVYRFLNAETGLLPDVGFYGASRRHLIVDRSKPIPFAPDLAVDVASPAQDTDDMAAKARLYLGGGTRLVWVVWPNRREVDVWRQGNLDAPAVTLRADAVLDGEDVVPDFRHPVADIFDVL